MKKKKRRHGGQSGYPKHRRQPFPADTIDETIVHKLSDEEVKRRELTKLSKTVLVLQQVSLPMNLYRVTEHRVQLYQTLDGKVLKVSRQSPVVGSDETGHKNPVFKSTWTWCWQMPSAALFYNVPSRGSQVLKAFLGEDFNGVVVCDFFSANKKFINDCYLQAQFCFAHLIRDLKFLTTLSTQNRETSKGIFETGSSSAFASTYAGMPTRN